MPVSLLYRRKHLLTNETYSITHTQKQTLHITYIPVLALFVSRTTIWRRSWLAQEERLFLRCHFFFFCFSKSVYILMFYYRFEVLTCYWKIIISIAMFFPFMKLLSIQWQILVTKKSRRKSGPLYSKSSKVPRQYFLLFFFFCKVRINFNDECRNFMCKNNVCSQTGFPKHFAIRCFDFSVSNFYIFCSNQPTV